METVAISKLRWHPNETRAVRGGDQFRSRGLLRGFYVCSLVAEHLRLNWKSSFEDKKTRTC